MPLALSLIGAAGAPARHVWTSGGAPHAAGATVLRQVAEGVLVHESEFVQSNAIVVQGRAGVLLIDAGVLDHEMACLANDLADLGQTVVAGFSTHPDWDHLLWHPALGAPPRYGTARCAAAVREQLVVRLGRSPRMDADMTCWAAETPTRASSGVLRRLPPNW